MRSICLSAVILAAFVGLASCSRDPQVAKKRYLESGNKYFQNGRYKEASIQYRNALKRDPKYGVAYYKLALTSLKTEDYVDAVQRLRRAVELISVDSPDHWDAVVKLTEIYLPLATRDKTYMDDADKYVAELLKRDPNSFDGHRLLGDLNYAKAIEAFKIRKNEDGQKLLDASAAEYKKADAIKPGDQGVLMQLARALAFHGDYAGSERLYRRVIEKDKTYANAYTELYRLFLSQQKPGASNQEQKPDAGEQVLKLAFQNNPKQYDFLKLLAAHYYRQGRRDEMLGVLTQIKSHARDFDQAYLTVGDFYLRTGDGDSAIREYREGISKDAKKKSTYEKRIIEVMMRQGNRSGAAELNGQILKDDPKDNDARGLAATFLLDKGDVAKALAELQEVVTRAPGNFVAHYNLGRAYAARAEWDQARQQFTKALELQPDYVTARLSLAQLQVIRGEFDSAVRSAERVLATDPGNVNARLIQSAALMGEKKFGDSRVMLDAMSKNNPGSADVQFQLGVVNLAESKFKEAEDAFRRSYQLNPANSRGLMGIVETDMAQNKTEAALALLQAETDKAPNRVDFRLALGTVAVRAGKFDLAITTFQKALELEKVSKSQGDIYLRLGETYRRKGDLGGAMQSLQKARETLPGNIMVLGTLAEVLDAAGRRTEAKQMYEAALKVDQNNPVALNNLAFLMAENNGDLDDALTKAQRAKQLLPNLAEISDTLGWIYLKKNLSDNAVEIFKDLVSKQPNQSTFHYHLAMALSQKGDRSRALEQLKEALKYNPSKEEKDKIQQMIVRLG
jgi:tetratricopeptide (TPR) repeat protein